MSRIGFTGITETLRTPGLAVQPPDLGGVHLFAQLQQALGAATDVAGAGINVANADRIVQNREFARQQREVDQFNADRADQARYEQHQTNLESGHGAQLGQEDKPRWLNDVKERKILRPPGVTDEQLPEFVRGELSRRLVGMPDATVQRYTDDLAPALIDAFYEQEKAIKTESVNHMASILRDKTATDSSPEAITQNVKTLTDMGVTEDAAYSAIVIPAMRTAASLGDGRFPAIKAALGGRFADEQAMAQAKYDAELKQQDATKYNDVEDHLLGRLDSGIPIDAVESEARRAMTMGAIDQGRFHRVQSVIDGQRKEMAKETTRIQTAATKAQYEQEATMQAHALAASREPGTGLYMLQDQEKVLPDGTKWKLDAKKVQQETTDAAVARFSERFKDNPNLAMAAQVDFVSRNGTIPSAWTALLNNADLDASISSVVTGPARAGQVSAPLSVPPNLQGAFDLYRRINAINPRVAARAVSSQSAGKLYDIAQAAMSLPEYGNNPDKAMVAAVRVANDATWWQTMEVNRTPINKAVSDLGGNNAGDVQRFIERNSRLFLQLNGVNDETAVKQARTSFEATHSLVNGTWVETSRADVGDADFIKQATSYAAKNYLPERGEDIPSDKLILRNVGGSDWVLYRSDIMQPVERVRRGQSYFTTNDLVSGMGRGQLSDGIERAAATKNAVKKAAQNQNDIQGERTTPVTIGQMDAINAFYKQNNP